MSKPETIIPSVESVRNRFNSAKWELPSAAERKSYEESISLIETSPAASALDLLQRDVLDVLRSAGNPRAFSQASDTLLVSVKGLQMSRRVASATELYMAAKTPMDVEIRNLMEDKRHLAATLQQRDTQIIHLQKRLEGFGTVSHKLNENLVARIVELEPFEALAKELQETVKSLASQLNEAQAKIVAAAQMEAQLRQDAEQDDVDNTALLTANTALTAQVQQLTEELELERATKPTAAVSETVSALEAEKAALKAQVVDLTAELNAEVLSDNAALRTRITELTAEVESLKAKPLGFSGSTLEVLQSEIDGLKKQLEAQGESAIREFKETTKPELMKFTKWLTSVVKWMNEVDSDNPLVGTVQALQQGLADMLDPEVGFKA